MYVSQDQTIASWVRMAENAARDGESEQRRYPFFQKVTIERDRDSMGTVTAFTRNISTNGIGLFHNAPLDKEKVRVIIPTRKGQTVGVDVALRWCVPCGNGWHISGGRFVDLAAQQSSKLISVAVISEENYRANQRYPLFRPVTIKTLSDGVTIAAAFGRDISFDGIGLVHNVALYPQRVLLSMDRSPEVIAEITWCEPCGEGLYTSGGRFQISVEEIPDVRQEASI
jgi:hypothetical protein